MNTCIRGQASIIKNSPTLPMVTFAPTDSTNYNGLTGNAYITVTKATPVVTWTNPADIVYGTALSGTQLNATASVSGTFAYTPAAGTVLSVGVNQPLTVTFTPTDTLDYDAVTTGANISVTTATVTITWPNPENIVYGTALGATQLNATASVSGTFVYTPGFGTVLSTGSNQALSAAFTPTDDLNYGSASATARITVTKATPVISWPNPVAIAYPTPLSAVQLNATASVSGTLVYSPTIGTVLSAANNQTLAVIFTPTDSSNYATASRTVYITVTAHNLTTSSKSASATQVSTGDTLTYTIRLVNTGIGNASATLSDPLPDQATYVNNSASATSGNAPSYSGGTLTWSGTISASSAVTVTFRATVNSGHAGGTAIANSATIGDGGTTITKSAIIWMLPPPVTTTVSNSAGGTVTSTGATTTTVSFPPGAVTEPITMTFTPTTTTNVPNSFRAVGNSFVIEATNQDGSPRTTFNRAFTITVRYNDADVVGIDESSLQINFFNEANNQWEPIATDRDPVNNVLTATLNHLTKFTVLGPQRWQIYFPLVHSNYSYSSQRINSSRQESNPLDWLAAFARGTLSLILSSR